MAIITNKLDTNTAETKFLRRSCEYILRASGASWWETSTFEKCDSIVAWNIQFKALRSRTLQAIAPDQNNHEANELSNDIFMATMALDGNKVLNTATGRRMVATPTRRRRGT
jgi:hypothetical protein